MTDVYEGNLGRLMNELRYRMEMAEWKLSWREAEKAKDYDSMDRLDIRYNYIGLP